MKKHIFIACGGIAGAILRYIMKNIEFNNFVANFPLATILINLSGSVILAFILTIAGVSRNFDNNLKLGISTGFLGAYTTFSTFCKESINLINQEFYYEAVFYVIISIFLGFGAAALGGYLAQTLGNKFIKKVK